MQLLMLNQAERSLCQSTPSLNWAGTKGVIVAGGMKTIAAGVAGGVAAEIPLWSARGAGGEGTQGIGIGTGKGIETDAVGAGTSTDEGTGGVATTTLATTLAGDRRPGLVAGESGTGASTSTFQTTTAMEAVVAEAERGKTMGSKGMGLGLLRDFGCPSRGSARSAMTSTTARIIPQGAGHAPRQCRS